MKSDELYRTILFYDDLLTKYLGKQNFQSKHWSKGLKLSGPKFQKRTKFFCPGTKIFNEKMGPVTKIFRIKIPVTVVSKVRVYILTRVS